MGNVVMSLLDPKKVMSRIEAGFWRFHRENLQVYAEFIRIVLELKGMGFTLFSSDAILHKIRWERAIRTRSIEGYKINDHYSAYYGRLLVLQYPEHRGFFEFRKLRSL